jgi:hypothetical protein
VDSSRPSRLRRTAARPRIPQPRRALEPRRGLLPRRGPLIGAPRPAILHGPLDLPGLSVRRPWWWLSTRRQLLRRRRAAEPSWPDSRRPDVANLPLAVPPPRPPDLRPALGRPGIVDPFLDRTGRAALAGPRPQPLLARRAALVAPYRAPAPSSAGASMPLAPSAPGHLVAALRARFAAPQFTAPGFTAPGFTAPGFTAAQAGAPASAAPGSAAPRSVVSGSAPPGSAAAGFGAPGLVAPGLVAPGLVAPRLAAPGSLTAGRPAASVQRTAKRAAPGPADLTAPDRAEVFGTPAGRPIGAATAPLIRRYPRTGPGRRLRRPETFGVYQVADLRVLGAAPVAAPSGGFDPSAALTVTPPAPTPVTAAASPAVGPAALRRATTPRMRPEAAPASAGTTPEARWRAAVATRPLERPQPFPASLRPLVAAVTGAERATYTTGPATREALAAAGAHGATSGSVVHLPTAPTTAPGPLLGVVTHELAHARRPVSRPRFLLSGLPGGGDDDERSALAIGRRFAGSLGGSALGGGAGSLGGALSGAVSDGADAIRAGIVNDLPVGGLSRVAGVADQARDAVTGGFSLPDVQLPGLGAGGLPGWPGAGMPGADLGSAASGAVSGAASAAMGAVGSAVDGATGAISGALGGTLGGASPPSHVDIDRLADLLEQRLLRQIERRGGRYAGVF